MPGDVDADLLEAVQAILALATGRAGWQVARTERGAAGGGYLASRDDNWLVLKFAALPPGLERLAQLGVTPGLVGCGEYQGRPWVLQEYVSGQHPRPSWFIEHLAELAAFLRRYHDDLLLHSLLLENPATVHAQDLTLAAAELRRARHVLGAIMPGAGDATHAFDRYEAQMHALDLGTEVAVHPDPNCGNFIVTEDAFFLIDWDGIQLSDALSDAGLMLWWYVPVERWPEFFAAFGLDLNKAALDRLYWWTARRSLQVAMWLVERGRQEAGRDFLIDFVAASCQRANPHWHP